MSRNHDAVILELTDLLPWHTPKPHPKHDAFVHSYNKATVFPRVTPQHKEQIMLHMIVCLSTTANQPTLDMSGDTEQHLVVKPVHTQPWSEKTAPERTQG